MIALQQIFTPLVQGGMDGNWIAQTPTSMSSFIQLIANICSSLWGTTTSTTRCCLLGFPEHPTKTMVVMVVHLRLRDLLLFLYINNWLLMADSETRLKKDNAKTLALLQDLVLQVNHKNQL